MSKELGKVSNDEAKEINLLFNEKAALSDLVISFNRAPELGIEINNNEIYQKIVSDMRDVNKRIVLWWERIAEKYDWQYTTFDVWMIDLKTNTVYLEDRDLKAGVGE